MQITIKVIGKLSFNLQEIIKNYIKRLRILKVNIVENNNDRNSLKWLFNNPLNSYSIVLSEHGINYTSLEFSKYLFSLSNKNYSKIIFMIGGASGISNDYINKANYNLSFGRLTYPHEIFRVLLVEQLYRAETIFLNHPYHK